SAAPRVVVLDNLREGVLKPDVYDPELNPLYRDVLRHYGVVAVPARVRDPDRKGKVESSIGHTQRTPLRGRRFELGRSLEHLRLGGMAQVLEARLRQAQAESWPPIDLISTLVSDELTRRADRLLG